MKETYGKKAYVQNKTIKQGRDYFRTRTGMQRFAGNYKHDQKFRASNWLCKCGHTVEEESHLMAGMCPVYYDITEKYDITDTDDLVAMFGEILARRDALDDSAAVVAGNATGVRQPVGATPGQAILDTYV